MLLFFDQSQSMIFVTQLNDGKMCVYLILKNTRKPRRHKGIKNNVIKYNHQRWELLIILLPYLPLELNTVLLVFRAF